MTHQPKISVLMSVYNSEETLKRAIESILSQTETNFEFLICDDGSTDESENILKKYASRDSRIILLRDGKNIGLTLRLNQLIDSAQGEFIARMDSDDESYPTRFALQLKALEGNDRAVLVCGTVDVVDQSGHVLSQVQVTNEKLLRLQKKNCITHGSIFLRKTALDTIGGYNKSIRYAQDYDLYLRLWGQGDFLIIKEPIYRLLISRKSVSNRKMLLQLHYVSLIQTNASSLRIRGLLWDFLYFKCLVINFIFTYRMGIPWLFLRTKRRI